MPYLYLERLISTNGNVLDKPLLHIAKYYYFNSIVGWVNILPKSGKPPLNVQCGFVGGNGDNAFITVADSQRFPDLPQLYLR